MEDARQDPKLFVDTTYQGIPVPDKLKEILYNSHLLFAKFYNQAEIDKLNKQQYETSYTNDTTPIYPVYGWVSIQRE